MNSLTSTIVPSCISTFAAASIWCNGLLPCHHAPLDSTMICLFFFFSSRRRHTRCLSDWSFRRVLFRSERELGATLGLLAGFRGGWTDSVIMTLADAQLAFPFILLAIGIIAVLGPSFPTLIVVIGLSGRSEERRVGKEGRSRWSPYH